MKSISVRDLRQRWPEAEALLEHEREILVTRDGKPVAKLVRVRKEVRRRKRFDPEKHRQWMRRVWGGKVVHWVDEFLIAERNAR